MHWSAIEGESSEREEYRVPRPHLHDGGGGAAWRSRWSGGEGEVEGGGGVGGGQGVVEENRKGRNLRRGQTSPLYLLEHCPLCTDRKKNFWKDDQGSRGGHRQTGERWSGVWGAHRDWCALLVLLLLTRDSNRLAARCSVEFPFALFAVKRKKTDNPREGWEEKKERKQAPREGWEDTARRHHTGILRRGVWC